MPWVGGTILMLVIALPWYVAAEEATPGFLKYFIVGEHWKRFTQSGWHGDMYGTAHSRPHGVIWLYWLGATFPWCLVFIGYMAKGAGRAKALFTDEWSSFLLIWAVTPMLFFSLAGNILWTYVLPGIPAFALLAADLLEGVTHPSGNGRSKWLLASAGLATPVFFTALVLLMPVETAKVSQKDLVYGYIKARPSQVSQLVYLSRRPYSAEFYSGGRALEANGAKGAEPFLHSGANFFVIEKSSLLRMPGWFKSRLVKVGDYGKYELLGEKPYMHTMAAQTCHPLS
jgi:4-amino-4-deoxy-L-arabinose transferase-like glycosyltransferase